MNRRLSHEQVRRVDQLAVSQYAMSGLVLMENAGRNAAEIIHKHFGGDGTAIILCGTGNNGGDGCVIARHLHNKGWKVRLMLAGEPSRMTPDTAANYAIVKAMGLEPVIAPDAATQLSFLHTSTVDVVIVDALLGTGFTGSVREPMATLIGAMHDASRLAVVAVDVPSGLDCDTGQPSGTAVRADLTITFVAEKLGFSSTHAKPYTGRVEVADIGVPRELIETIAD